MKRGKEKREREIESEREAGVVVGWFCYRRSLVRPMPRSPLSFYNRKAHISQAVSPHGWFPVATALSSLPCTQCQPQPPFGLYLTSPPLFPASTCPFNRPPSFSLSLFLPLSLPVQKKDRKAIVMKTYEIYSILALAGPIKESLDTQPSSPFLSPFPFYFFLFSGPDNIFSDSMLHHQYFF